MDQRLRQDERNGLAGDIEAQARSLAQKLRASHIRKEHLSFANFMGDLAAGQILGPPKIIFDVVPNSNHPTWQLWKFHLKTLGKYPAVLACYLAVAGGLQQCRAAGLDEGRVTGYFLDDAWDIPGLLKATRAYLLTKEKTHVVTPAGRFSDLGSQRGFHRSLWCLHDTLYRDRYWADSAECLRTAVNGHFIPATKRIAIVGPTHHQTSIPAIQFFTDESGLINLIRRQLADWAVGKELSLPSFSTIT